MLDFKLLLASVYREAAGVIASRLLMSRHKERWIVRDYFDRDIMAGEITKCKNLRKNKLSAFTRKRNQLQGLIDSRADSDKLNEVLSELKAAFSVLENAHDSYACLVEENTLDEEGDYLAQPSESLNEMDAKVTDRLKEHREAEAESDTRNKIEQQRLKLRNEITSFGSPSVLISQLSSEKKISQEDMRKEMVKIEGWYDDLHTEKLKLLNLSSSEDFSDLVTQFDSLVVKELDKCKAIALEYLKDVPATLTPSVEGGSVSSRGSFSTTKRETVMLPQFSGDEKTAYLCYPVWKKQ